MSLRQLRTRIEHLEAKAPEPEECAARARWEELRLMEKPLTEEEEAELNELTYRFHPLGRAMKAWEKAAAEAEQRDRDSS